MAETRFTGRRSKTYVATSDVAEMVELAITLQKPLLVEGEAGCGKTRLAYAVAEELRLGTPVGVPVKIAVKSTSRAQSLLWRFDSLRRLQDAQIPGNQTARRIYPYLSLGPLGTALQGDKRSVVLIDEIDKADIDFPNDLLDVLDEFEFQITDLPEDEARDCEANKGFGRTVRAKKRARPIVIITSNREKRLPEAFLRRCLYARLRFPREEKVLASIVRKNTGLSENQLDKDILKTVVGRFIGIRDRAVEQDAQKPPSTSELIDWVRILHWKGIAPESITADTKLPPYWRTLFKTYPDLEAFEASGNST